MKAGAREIERVTEIERGSSEGKTNIAHFHITTHTIEKKHLTDMPMDFEAFEEEEEGGRGNFVYIRQWIWVCECVCRLVVPK